MSLRTATKRYAIACLILLAAAEFAVRGPVRFLHSIDFNDFISPFVQTRAWLAGADPYAPASLIKFWPSEAVRPEFLRTDSNDGTLELKRGIPTAYPPTAFVLIAPLASIPSWPLAARSWMILSLTLLAGMLICLARLAKDLEDETGGYFLLVFALGLAPIHSGLAAGSIIIPVVATCAVAVYGAWRRKDLTAGALIGIALCLKPQVGLPFLFYFLVKRRWSIVSASLLLTVGLTMLSLGWLSSHHTQWVSSYIRDNRVLLGPGSLGDFTELNPLRFGLLNLQVATYTMLGNRNAANSMAFLITGMLGLRWLWLACTKIAGDQILQISTICVISLLPIYHRFYDASLLVFPLVWAISVLRDRDQKGNAFAVLALLSCFLVPGGTMLHQWETMGQIPDWIAASWWWSMLLKPHEIWALLFLTVILLRAMGIATRPRFVPNLSAPSVETHSL